MKSLFLLSVLFAAGITHAEPGLHHFYAKSELITSDGDDLVTLAVNGDVAKKLYNSLKADPSNDGDGRVSKNADAISCTQIGSKAPFLYTCSYVFRDDGTLIQ